MVFQKGQRGREVFLSHLVQATMDSTDKLIVKDPVLICMVGNWHLLRKSLKFLRVLIFIIYRSLFIDLSVVWSTCDTNN